MPSVERLKERLTRTLKAKRLDAALGALTLLAKEEPDEPKWPRRAAHLLRVRSDTRGAVAAHRRALELQVDQGLVLDAIATCKAILDLEPEDPRTLETLDLLCADGPSTAEARTPGPASSQKRTRRSTSRKPGRSLKRPVEPRPDAPIDSLLLRDVVPGARSIQIGEAGPDRVSEIPIEESRRLEEEVPDLRLDRWSPSDDERGLQTPQSEPADLRETKRSSGERGASLRSELANIPLFGDLDPNSLHTLIRKVRIVLLEAGQVLFREGDTANTLYVVVEGAVVPIAEGSRRRKLAVLERGEFFGEIGLMAKQPRNATIEALVETKLLAIDRRVVWELIQAEPSVAKTILRFLRARLIDRQIRTNLFFSAFAHAERESVARQFRFLEVRADTTIIEAGKAPEGLFVVLSGSLALRDERGKEIGGLGLGDVFGGLALIDGRIAPADVVARGKCWLVVLGEGRFRRIMEANPRLDRILRRIARETPSGAERESVLGL